MDVFIEKIVPKKKGMIDVLITAGAILGGFIVSYLMLLLLGASLGGVALFLVIGVFYLAFILIRSRNIEFEYAVTNGEIDIDKIIAQKKRKRLFSANCRDFDVVAKVSSDKYTQEIKNIQKCIQAMSSMTSPDVYFIALNYKGEKTVVYFEPDERMLAAFKALIPRKVFDI